MMTWFTVAIGGALGACLRYGLSLLITGSRFPLATFVANGVGCFLIGLAFVLIIERGLLTESWRFFVITGSLGALTTFSTFSLEALILLRSAHYGMALLYISGTLFVCMLSVSLGLLAGKYLF